ncbi:MAG TPA: DNA-processing protein DprA [Candidatus Saccharimonadales bacterium]|nr:DNA-processing protein DprA [Candidatus Saccharimonadales bacterium]
MSEAVAKASFVSSRDREMLALALTPQLGPTRVRRLFERIPRTEDIFHASLTELEATGLPAASAQSIALGNSLRLADEELKKLAKAPGVSLVTMGSELYPEHLAEIYDPPLVLYVRGDTRILSETGIAMVGTRHPTPYGLGMAERLAIDLSNCGLVIISGMARGIDSIAHKGAVEARGRTIAVFGTGVDIIYPRENRKLSEQILEFGGALISEFPIGTSPAPHNFPLRNRIISGLSRGVLVVEAGEFSGTRITSRCALEQCREVFAVPGNVTNKLAWTPNTLIKQGAKLVATWEDVFEELPTEIRIKLQERQSEPSQPRSASLFDPPPASELPAGQQKVFSVIKADESIHVDELIEKFDSQLSSSEIFSALFELEMSNKIRCLPGKNYVRVF